jgi:anti-anti-sigma factor
METLYTVVKDCLVVVPSARMDTNSSPEVVEKLTEKIQNGELKIIIDFNKTEYVSSAGLRVILVIAKLLQPINGKFALCNANDQILEELEISGFHSIVRYFDGLDAAVDFVCE